ncbi:hypothetical protein MTO96_038230 [Rhipicephalus appendiculatus]
MDFLGNSMMPTNRLTLSKKDTNFKAGNVVVLQLNASVCIGLATAHEASYLSERAALECVGLLTRTMVKQQLLKLRQGKMISTVVEAGSSYYFLLFASPLLAVFKMKSVLLNT